MIETCENISITVVTVCYNAVNDIEKTIMSVLGQTYKNIEYIIIDGGSIDGTIDIINKYKEHISLFVSEPDKGIYDAMNKGLMKANGQWINFMNAGDTFASNSVISNIFGCNEGDLINYDVIYGDCIACISLGERYASVKKTFWNDKSIVPSKGFSHQSVFVRTEIAKLMPFNLKYKICADFDMMFRLYKTGHNFLYMNFAIAKYEVENGFSKKHAALALKENAMIVGVESDLRFKCYYIFFIIKENTRKVVSSFVKKFFPKIFNYIKMKRL